MELGKTLIQACPFLHRKIEYGSRKKESRLLFIIEDRGFIAFGVDRGNIPCCYIASRDSDVFETTPDVETLPYQPHGGFTFSGTARPRFFLKEEDAHILWVGWDYGHYGDFNGILPINLNKDNKKWATIELIEHTKELIDYYNDIKRKDN